MSDLKPTSFPTRCMFCDAPLGVSPVPHKPNCKVLEILGRQDRPQQMTPPERVTEPWPQAEAIDNIFDHVMADDNAEHRARILMVFEESIAAGNYVDAAASGTKSEEFNLPDTLLTVMAAGFEIGVDAERLRVEALDEAESDQAKVDRLAYQILDILNNMEQTPNQQTLWKMLHGYMLTRRAEQQEPRL